MLTAGAIMTTDIVTSRPNVSIEAAIDTLLSEEISGLPVTDDDGRYSIAGVPPGSYTLVIWSELGHADNKEISLGAGENVDVDFRVTR